VTGPGVAALPLVFVSAGWLPSLLLLGILLLASGTASQLLCDAIRALPGNADYGRRVELLSATQELLPYWAYCAAFVTFIARCAPCEAVGTPTRCPQH
jgi:amino acid permease